MKKIVVLTGAGISAESGISTFRDSNGLWENHDIMEVASPQGWENNPALVLDFYNKRRRQAHKAKPNSAHLALAELEKNYKVVVITQNVDNLHEKAGSSNIIHLHGQLMVVRSTIDPFYAREETGDIHIGDLCPKGGQLRPHIVWFGEPVPMLNQAAMEVSTADIIIIIGTSMAVYPAAGLVAYASNSTPIYYIDPKPTINFELSNRSKLVVIDKVATKGMKELMEILQ